jgi:hypothetical protein
MLTIRWRKAWARNEKETRTEERKEKSTEEWREEEWEALVWHA